MSLCTVIFDENLIIMSGDSRLTAKVNGEHRMLGDYSKKIKIAKGKLFFTAGIVSLNDTIIDKYEKSDDDSIENLRNICIELTNKAIEKFAESKREIPCELNKLTDLVVACFEDGYPSIHTLRHEENFRITKHEPNDPINILVCGVKCEEALSFLEQKWTPNEPDDYTVDAIANMLQTMYEELSYESIGGKLYVYQMDDQNNIDLVKETKIKDRLDTLKTVYKGEAVELAITGDVTLKGLNNAGKQMFKAAGIGQKTLSTGNKTISYVDNALTGIDDVAKSLDNTQVKYTTLRVPKNIKPAGDPMPQVKVTRTPDGDIFNQVKLTTPKGETIKASEQIGPAKISITKPMMGRAAKVENKIDDLIKNSDQWKDKQPLAYQRETWDRNIIDVAGEAGEKIKSYLFEPIHQNEASRTRYLNNARDRIKSLNLTKADSELVQLVGEGRINPATIDPLKRPKIENAVNVFRDFYNNALDEANKVLVRNGYAEIPKRKDYFPHFQGKDPVMEALGIDINLVDLPTDINGLTANFKPGKNWFGNFLQRKGDLTKFDAVEGFDRYVEGISRVIHHTDDIQKLRTFTGKIRDKNAGSTKLSNMVADLDEYTNVLAGKKDLADRGAERLFGRQIYNITDAIRKRVGANMVAFNPASWLTNVIPVNTALATTRKDVVLQALADTMKNVVKNDGFINRSTFLTNRVGSDILSKSKIDKASEVVTAPFKWIDNFSSQIVTRAKYLEDIKKGYTPEQALKHADEWAAKVMGDRSLGATPTLFNQRGPITSWITQFQLEVNNQLSLLSKDLPREFLASGVNAENVARLTSAIGQLLIYDYIYNNIYEQLTGRRPALDPIGIAFDAVEDFKNKDAATAAGNTVKNVAQQLPFTGLFTNGGRLPIGNALPDLGEVFKASTELSAGETPASVALPKIGKQLINPAAYLVPPIGGGQIKKSIEGLNTVSKGGEYITTKDGKKALKYPVSDTAENKIKAGIFGKSSLPEAQEYYDKGTKPLSVNQTEALDKAVAAGMPRKVVYDQIIELRKYDKKSTEILNIRANKNLTKSQQDTLIKLLYPPTK